MDNVKLHSALDSLERKTSAKIEESYNKFFENVKQTIDALIQSSVSHISDIENCLKLEIAEVKKMYINDNVEAVNEEMNDSENKYLKLKPINLLKENALLRSYEQHNQLSKHDQLMSLDNGNAVDVLTSILELQDSQNARIGKTTTEIQNDKSVKNIKRVANINVCGKGQTRVFECNLCDHKSYMKRIIYEHIVEVHNVNSRILSKYKCTQCSFTAKTSFLVTKHERLEHDDSKMHLCQKCHGTFTTNFIKRHICSSKLQYVWPSSSAFTEKPFQRQNEI